MVHYSDIAVHSATFGLLKSASETSKLTTDHAEKDLLICVQRFGIQFIRKIISQWPSLMGSLNGTRAIALCKSVLDVIRYMDMRDDDARCGCVLCRRRCSISDLSGLGALSSG